MTVRNAQAWQAPQFTEKPHKALLETCSFSPYLITESKNC